MPVLDQEFNAVVSYMGGRVPHTLTRDDYPDFEAMRSDWYQTGSLKVNVLNSDNTIFGAPFINYYFRAWHDYCHILANGDFSQYGEMKAAEKMKETMRVHLPDLTPEQLQRFDRLIDAEVIGQGEYFITHGHFPFNQYEFTKEYITAGKQVAQ